MKNKKFYITVLFLFALFLTVWSIGLRNKHNTDSIYVAANFTILECAPTIRLATPKNIEDFYQTNFLSHSLDEQICTMNSVFDGSIQDRIHLVGFSDAKLKVFMVNRPDIAQYFYRKAVDANPDDSLSQYIKSEKIRN